MALTPPSSRHGRNFADRVDRHECLGLGLVEDLEHLLRQRIRRDEVLIGLREQALVDRAERVVTLGKRLSRPGEIVVEPLENVKPVHVDDLGVVGDLEVFEKVLGAAEILEFFFERGERHGSGS